MDTYPDGSPKSVTAVAFGLLEDCISAARAQEVDDPLWTLLREFYFYLQEELEAE